MIVICSPQSVRKVSLLGFPWVYLGEDAIQATNIEHRFPSKRIEIGDKLQETAASLRQPYIDYIGQLSLAHNSLLWWISSLSEKNPWTSKTFLHVCYIKLCQNIVSKQQEDLLIIAKSHALRKALAQNLQNAQNIESWEDTLQGIKNVAHTTIRKLHFVVSSIYKTLLAHHYKLKQIAVVDGEGIVLLQNWVDQRSFDVANGKYHDNYFGELASYLRSQGQTVITMPLIRYNMPYRQTLKRLKQISGRCLIPEAYLTMPDIGTIFIRALLPIVGLRNYPRFEDLDISKLIIDDLNRNREGNDPVYNLLLYKAIKRWRKADISVSHFIYAYENQTWEKACLSALRKFYPNIRVTGYQHATVPKMLLNYFFSKAELPVMPFPDRVITTGRYTERLFKESGYAPTKVVCGGALRYNQVQQRQQSKQTNTTGDGGRHVILVTPSIDNNEVIELVWKVLQAFGQCPQYKVIFKFHPDYPYSSIINRLGTFPNHFVVSDKPVSELLLESGVLLYTSSTTSIEALALGIPVLHIKSSLNIDRDNLSDFPNARESISDPENMAQVVDKILSRSRFAQPKIVLEMLPPARKSTFELFL